MNPFAKKQNKPSQTGAAKDIQDPLSVEDLLVDGTSKATITSEGQLISKKDALKDNVEHIDLLKQREWGTSILQRASNLGYFVPWFRTAEFTARVMFYKSQGDSWESAIRKAVGDVL